MSGSVVIFAGVLMEISSALLVSEFGMCIAPCPPDLYLQLSGILGVKAYKCLDDSRWVLAIISVLQAASSSLVLADMFRLQTQRTLVGMCCSVCCENDGKRMFESTGSCCIVSELWLVLLGIIARLFIAFFICLCCMYSLLPA